MTTIVDALIVTLGLDGSKFKQESKKSGDDLRKMSSESDRTAKVMEAKGKQAAQFYAQIRNEALSLIAVFTGGRALKNFAEDTINNAANLGMMAENLQMSTERLSSFQRAAERAGGSSAGMTAQLLESQSAAAKYSMGMIDESMQWFYRLGGSDRALKDGNTYLLARADIIHKLYQTDPGRAKLAAQSMGISPEQFNLMKMGSAGLLELVAAQEKNAAVTAEGAKQALALRNKMLDLRDRLESTATTILLRLAPAIERGVARLEKMADWVAAHKDDISKWIDSTVSAIGDFVSALDRAAQAVGGWKNVLIALAALKVLGMVASVVQLAGALAGVGAALGGIASGAAAVGILGAIGASAGTAALAVGALGLAVVGMSAALNAADPDVDEKNHAGMRRVRRRGKADEWVKDEKLSQEHAGEHYVRAGRGGGWVKDAPQAAPIKSGLPTPTPAAPVAPGAAVVPPVTPRATVDAATPTPAAPVAPGAAKTPDNNQPGWLDKFFGGKVDNSAQAGGRYKAGAPRGGATPPTVQVTATSPAVNVSVNVQAPGAQDKPRDADKDLIDVVRKLMAVGWTQKQAAGIAGSLQQESGLDPAAKNPDSGAYGIGQWLGSRVKDFERIMGKKLQGSTLDDQLKFQQWEMTNTEKSAGDKIRATKTAEDAARVHSQSYERPGADEANNDRRALNASRILASVQSLNAQSTAAIPQQVSTATTTNSRSTSTSTSTSETNFTGPITITTQAKDAEGVARGLKTELSKFSYVPQANTGML